MLQIGLDSQATTNWLLVVVTAVYCFLTYKIVQKNGEMVAQMRAQYESFIAPIITTTIQLKHSVFIYLKIRNKGQSAAKNLRFTLDRDFYQAGEFNEDRNIRNFPVFQRPIPSFGPDEEIFILLSQGFNLDKKDGEKAITPYEFTIDTQYEFAGKAYMHRHEVNLHAYLMTSQDRSEVLDELQKIRKALEQR